MTFEIKRRCYLLLILPLGAYNKLDCSVIAFPKGGTSHKVFLDLIVHVSDKFVSIKFWQNKLFSN